MGVEGGTQYFATLLAFDYRDVREKRRGPKVSHVKANMGLLSLSTPAAEAFTHMCCRIAREQEVMKIWKKEKMLLKE